MGDRGTGKTTLTKSIVSGLGAAGEDEVTSPTFTLVHIYGKLAKVYHADLYRIESFHDFQTFRMEDMFATPSMAILQWFERFPLRTSWPHARIHIDHSGGAGRRLIFLYPTGN